MRSLSGWVAFRFGCTTCMIYLMKVQFRHQGRLYVTCHLLHLSVGVSRAAVQNAPDSMVRTLVPTCPCPAELNDV